MKSSTGAHYLALDHIRAVAALLVVTWHFTHGHFGTPVPFEYTPSVFPLAIFDQGHTGVALFMTLSGYLFAKLLDGKQIRYSAFLWNRAVRLLPLLLVVIALVGALVVITHRSLREYLVGVVQGVVLPTLPNGGWSITVEFHFYLVLPLLLFFARRHRALPLVLLLLSAGLRVVFLQLDGSVHTLAYGTLVGRLDQFVLGIVAFSYRDQLRGKHAIAVLAMLGFMLFYWWFDRTGASTSSPLWVVIPTIEGLAYALVIVWYDTSFTPSTGPISRFIGRAGEYSYSIYLLHFFLFERVALFIHTRVVPLSNFYLASLFALLFMLGMMIPGYLSYRFIEAPFLKLRRRYIVERSAP